MQIMFWEEVNSTSPIEWTRMIYKNLLSEFKLINKKKHLAVAVSLETK